MFVVWGVLVALRIMITLSPPLDELLVGDDIGCGCVIDK